MEENWTWSGGCLWEDFFIFSLFCWTFFFFFLVEGIAAHLSAGLKEPVEWETDDTGEDGARSCAHAEGQP